MGNSPRTPRTGEVKQRLLEYVAANPGCTSGQVRRALGSSSAAMLATLYDRDLIDRKCDAAKDLLWHYYPKSDA